MTANSNASVTNDTNRAAHLDASYTEFSPNMNYTLPSQKKFVASRGTTGPNAYAANNFFLKSIFTSSDSKVSPAVDLSRMNLITVENLVNRGSVANSDFVITVGGSGYSANQTGIAVSGGGGTGGVVTAVESGGAMTSVEVTSAGSGYYETPTIAITGAATATVQNELASAGGNAKARYISRRVTLEDGFDAQDIKVWLNAYKPQDTDIKVYFRVHNAEDPEDFESKPYTLMTQETDANLISASEADTYQ